MILIDPVIFSAARLRAIRLGNLTLTKYIESLIYHDLKQNDSELFNSSIDEPKNKQLFTDAFSDAQNEEILPLGIAKEMRKSDLRNEIYMIESFLDYTEGGDPPDYPPSDNWRKYHCIQQFVLDLKVYNKYLLIAKSKGKTGRRFVNEIIKEWIDMKRIEEQDRIEREAHSGS